MGKKHENNDAYIKIKPVYINSIADNIFMVKGNLSAKRGYLVWFGLDLGVYFILNNF